MILGLPRHRSAREKVAVLLRSFPDRIDLPVKKQRQTRMDRIGNGSDYEADPAPVIQRDVPVLEKLGFLRCPKKFLDCVQQVLRCALFGVILAKSIGSRESQHARRSFSFFRSWGLSLAGANLRRAIRLARRWRPRHRIHEGSYRKDGDE